MEPKPLEITHRDIPDHMEVYFSELMASNGDVIRKRERVIVWRTQLVEIANWLIEKGVVQHPKRFAPLQGKITEKDLFDHPIYADIETFSDRTMALKASDMAAIANFFVSHGFFRQMPQWVEVTSDLKSLPPEDKVVVLRTKAGDEFLGGITQWEDGLIWCDTVQHSWSQSHQEVLASFMARERHFQEADDISDWIESRQITHWREI